MPVFPRVPPLSSQTTQPEPQPLHSQILRDISTHPSRRKEPQTPNLNPKRSILRYRQSSLNKTKTKQNRFCGTYQHVRASRIAACARSSSPALCYDRLRAPPPYSTPSGAHNLRYITGAHNLRTTPSARPGPTLHDPALPYTVTSLIRPPPPVGP